MCDPMLRCFLSCSFAQEDTEVVELVRSVCEGMNFHCVNVSEAATTVPPEVAKNLICSSDILVAVATKRRKGEGDVWYMPDAVHDELSIAYGLGKPILSFVEEGVEVRGFFQNYGTYSRFLRNRLQTPLGVKEIVASVRNARTQVLTSRRMVAAPGPRGYYAERVSSSTELVERDGHFTWQSDDTRRYRFVASDYEPIVMAVWSASPPRDATEKIAWRVAFRGGSRQFKVTPQVQIDRPDKVELRLQIDPRPAKDDYVEVAFLCSSKYLNPIYKEDIAGCPAYVVGPKRFDAYDGFLAVQPTHELVFQMRFAGSYGVSVNDLYPFAVTHTTGIDYEVDAERKRMRVGIDDFGGKILADLRVDNALIGHMYGFAWNLPDRMTR